MVRDEYNHSRPVSALIRDWLLYNKAGGGGGILKTVTGNPISVSDALAARIQSLSVSLSPIQDLHGQDAPYPAGGGANLLPPVLRNNAESLTNNGVTLTIVNQKFHLSGTGTSNGGRNALRSAGVVLPAGTYTLVGSAVLMYADTTIIFDKVFTLTEEAEVYIGFNIATGTVYNEDREIAIVKGDTAVAWSPYSNICPITGRDSVTVTRSGVNVWDEEWEVGVINADGAPGSSTVNCIRSKNFCSIVGGETYYATCGKTDGGSQNVYYIGAYFYDADKTFIGRLWVNNLTFTAPDNARYFKLSTNSSTVVYGNTYNHDITVNYPSTDRDYHPGTVASVEVQLGQTVYGGTLDVVSGKLTVDFAIKVFNGTENYSDAYFPTIVCTDGGGDLSPIGDYNRRSELVCSHASDVSFASASAQIIQWRYADTIFGVSNAAEFKAYVAQQYTNGTPVTVAYPIATPQTVQLTPATLSTLKGDNNVWSDGDDVTMTYKAVT